MELKSNRQLARQFNLAFFVPTQGSLPCLDGWLDKILEIRAEAPQSVLFPLQSPDARLAAQWLWRALLLARELMQAGRIPVFDMPGIKVLEPNAKTPGTWNATVTLPLIDHLDPVAYIVAMDNALRWCVSAGSNPVNDANLQELFAAAEKLVADRLSKLMSRGQSTLPVLRVAHAKDIPFIHLGGGVFQLGWGSKARRLERSITERDSVIGAKLAQGKVLTARLLHMAGLPGPRHNVVGNADDALQVARQLGWPVVVKPTDRDRGEGVTVDVADEKALRVAFEVAATLSRTREAIIEQQVDGVCHRLFIANRTLLYAVKRLPMSVQGDGRQNIAQLVDAEVRRQLGAPPWKRSKIRPLDELAHAALRMVGYNALSVPVAGVLVPLRRIESTEWGGIDEEVTRHIHPENLKIALMATDLFGLHVTGIDIITPDIGRPWFENGAIINEVNFAPLLGGGDISRRHIPQFLDAYMAGKGRIPVEVFVGGNSAWEVAAKRWQVLLADGFGACLTSATSTLAPSGGEWHMPFSSAYQRARALVLSSQVDAIVLVVQTDEFLGSGLPFESIDRLVPVDDHLQTYASPAAPLAADRLAALRDTLDSWQVFRAWPE